MSAKDSSAVGAIEEPSLMSKAWGDVKELGSGLLDLAGKTTESYNRGGLTGVVGDVGSFIGENPEEAANIAGRGAMMTAGGALAAPATLFGIPAAIPFGAAAGGAAWDAISGAVTEGIDYLGGGEFETDKVIPSWDALRRDVVQTAAPIAGVAAVSKAAPAIANFAGKPIKPRLDVKGTLNDPVNKQVIALGEQDIGHPLANRAQQLQGLERGSQMLGEQTADIVAQNMAVLDSSVASNLGTYQLLKNATPTLEQSGVLTSRLSGPALAAKADELAQAAYSPLVTKAKQLDAALGGEKFSFDTIQNSVEQVLTETEKLGMLASSEGVSQAARGTMQELQAAFQKFRGYGEQPGLNASQLLELAQDINFTESRIMSLFDDPNLVAQLKAKNMMAPAELETSARVFSAARESIYDLLGQQAVQKGVAPSADIFKQGASTYGAMQTLKRVVANQELVRGSGLSAVSARRVSQTQGEQATKPTRLSATDITSPTTSAMVRLGNAIIPDRSPSTTAAMRIRAAGQPQAGANLIADTLEAQQAGLAPRSVLRYPGQQTWGGIERGAQSVSQTVDLIKKKLGVVDAPAVAGLRALMPIHEPIADRPMIPRSLKTLNPGVMINSIVGTVEPYNIQPIMETFTKVYASGDKEELGRFVAALARKYPTLPLEKGPKTGLPSELVREDGNSYLSDPLDIARWEQKIKEMPISEDEKALRVMNLRKSGRVYDMTARLNLPAAPTSNASIPNQALITGYGEQP
jgi:hypothetical protein